MSLYSSTAGDNYMWELGELDTVIIHSKPKTMWDKIKAFVENNLVVIMIGTALAVVATAYLAFKKK
jgi:hypothetical protein